MSDTPGQPFLDDYLQFLLATASGLASDGFHRHAVAQGVPVPEWRVLACLSDRDGQAVTELARLAQMEQSRLTRIIERMDKRGLVTRQRCEVDRRRVYVFLTDAGRALAHRLVAEARSHEGDFMANCLTPAEGRRLKQLLTRIIQRAGIDHAVRR